MFAGNRKSRAPGKILGIDIGTTAIKVVEGDQEKEKPELVTYGIGELRHFFEKSEKRSSYDTHASDIVSRSLRMTLERADVGTRDAILTLPSSASHIAFIELPKDESGGYGKRMVHEIERAIPFPIPDVFFEWVKVDDWQNAQGQAVERFLIIAIERRERAWYETVTRSAGVRVQKCVFSGIALAKALETSSAAPHLVIDIGARSSSLFITRGGVLEYGNRIDSAGGALTQSIAAGLGLALERAEDVKRERGLSRAGADYELERVMKSSLGILVNAVLAARAEYARRYEVECAVFSVIGGGSRLKGLPEHLAGETSMTSIPLEIFSRVLYPDGLAPLTDDLVSFLTPALSAALFH